MSEAWVAPVRRNEVIDRGSRWIESSRFDLVFFVFPAVLTIPIVVASYKEFAPIAALGFVLAFSHYFSTLTFFLWEENQAEHRKRWAAFFGGPVLIVLLFIMLVVLEIPLIIQVAILFWNSYHVARQNCGLLSLYRQSNGVVDQKHRDLANSAIVSVALWLTLWNVESNPEVIQFLGLFGQWTSDVLWIGIGSWAVFSTIQLLRSLYERRAGGSSIPLSELLFLGTSLTFFHPYLWIEDSGGATFVMLLPHYIQYLAIVWLLQRRRFPKSDERRFGHRALHRVSHNLPLLVAVMLGLGATLLTLKMVAGGAGYAAHFEGFYLTVAFIHFYLDGLIWAFRDPHVRSTMGPLLRKVS